MEEIGSVAVEVRADLGPLAADFARGEQQAQRFHGRMKQGAGATTTALANLGAAGSASLNRIRLAGEKAAEAAALLTGPLGGVASRISILSRVTSGWGLVTLGASVAMGGLAVGIKRAADESEKFERLMRRTEGVLKATAFAAGVTAGEVRDMADELDDTTLIDPAEAEQATQLLLTFKNVQGDVFRQAVALSADLSVLFGNMSAGALQLGKALEEPISGMGALRRSGISFSPVQQEQIKNFAKMGQLLEAQKIILAAVAGQVGGLAKNEAAGLTAATDDMSDAWARFQRAIGDAGPIKGAISAVLRLGAAVVEATRRMAMPTGVERFEDVTSRLKAAESELAALRERHSVVLAPRLEAEIAALRRRRNELGAELMVTQSLIDLDDERERSTARAGQAAQKAAAEAEAAAARAKERLPSELAAENSAAQDHLRVVLAANDKEQASNEALFTAGEKSVAAYYSRRKQLATEAIAAEIAALEKQREVVSRSPVENETEEIDRARELASINAEIAAKETERATVNIQLESEAGAQAIGLRREILQMEAEMKAAMGDRFANEHAALDESIAKYDEIMKRSGMGDDQRQAHLDRFREVSEARIGLAEAQRDAEIVLADIGSKVAEIQQLAARGIITDGQAQAQIIALQRSRIPVLDAIIVRMEKLEKVASSPEQKQAIADLRVAVGGLTVETDRLGVAWAGVVRTLGQDLRSATSGLFQDLITDSANWKDHLLNFFGQVSSAFAKLAADMATKALFGDLAGGGGGGGFNWGALLGRLVGAAIGGAAGGGSGTLAGGGNPYGATDPGLAQLPFTYHAGTNSVGTGGTRTNRVHSAAFIRAPRYHNGIRGVGNLGLRPDERAAILQTGEVVLSRTEARGGAMRGGVTVIQNITTPDPNSFRGSERQTQRLARRTLGV